MANTYIVSGSQFKPYTFDEMIKPALLYKQAYEDTEKKLESLEEVGIDENSFLEQDAASKELYNNYMSQLQQTADALNNGYNAEVAKQARNLHKIFKTKINPMKTKLAIRAALTEEQRKLKNANPYLEFSKDYSTTSLDDITETSTYKTRDLSKISSEIAADMTKFIASMTPEFTPDTISGVGNTLTTKYGYTPKEAFTQIKTEGTELNEKFKKYLDKYKDASFSDDMLINTIENTMVSNAGASDTQFIKSKNDSTGGYWLPVGNKTYYMSESGTVQLEADWDGTNISNVTKPSGGSSSSGSYIPNLDNMVYWLDGSTWKNEIDSNTTITKDGKTVWEGTTAIHKKWDDLKEQTKQKIQDIALSTSIDIETLLQYYDVTEGDNSFKFIKKIKVSPITNNNTPNMENQIPIIN